MEGRILSSICVHRFPSASQFVPGFAQKTEKSINFFPGRAKVADCTVADNALAPEVAGESIKRGEFRMPLLWFPDEDYLAGLDAFSGPVEILEDGLECFQAIIENARDDEAQAIAG